MIGMHRFLAFRVPKGHTHSPGKTEKPLPRAETAVVLTVPAVSPEQKPRSFLAPRPRERAALAGPMRASPTASLGSGQ